MAKKAEKVKKFHKAENKIARWSDGFSTKKGDKPDKKNKANKTDIIEFEDDTVIMLDEDAEVDEIIGNVMIFAVEGKKLKVKGKRIV